MRYFGGKTRTCKLIAEIIENKREENQVFISPFTGGGWVESLIKDPKICSDKHKYLIAMYKEMQNGWEPPEQISEEEYVYIKNNPDEKPYLTGFVGFGCSFAGKWFGGYAREKSKRNFCLNAKNSIMKKFQGFNNTKFICKDYRELQPENNTIYCDPPYCGTTPYSKNVVGDFNHEEFWDVMRKWSSNNTVIISEYNAPNDFICIWEKPVKLDILDGVKVKKHRVEKLFQFKNGYRIRD